MKAKLTYTGIRVKDLDRSIEFYTKVLGMHETGRGTIEDTKGEVVSLVSEDGGPTLELNRYGRGSRFDTKYEVGEALDHIAFQVEDLDAFLREAKRSGHRVPLEMKTDTSRYAYIEDPNGIWIEVFA
jgi:lactoylglutathione lyase